MLLDFHKKNGLFFKTLSQDHFRVFENFLAHCMTLKNEKKFIIDATEFFKKNFLNPLTVDNL